AFEAREPAEPVGREAGGRPEAPGEMLAAPADLVGQRTARRAGRAGKPSHRPAYRPVFAVVAGEAPGEEAIEQDESRLGILRVAERAAERIRLPADQVAKRRDLVGDGGKRR